MSSVPRRRAATLATLAVVLILGAVLAACGSAAAPESFDPNAPPITAPGLKFDKTELDAPANQGFEVVLFNKDGTSHNFSIYSDPGHGQRVFGGDLSNGGTKVYHVQALAPGTYYFECDVHPGMSGTLVVR